MSTGLRVTLLGTGSPRPDLRRSQPAALVRWGEDEQVLVDCGDGTVHRLQEAGISLDRVTRVMFTHLHWDHVLGYPSLVWGTWAFGRTELRVWGPRGTRTMHDRLVADWYAEQAAMAKSLGYDPRGWDDVAVEEVADGTVVALPGCTVRFAHVVHPPIEAFGLRFEHGGRSLVISGDTVACDELVLLADGADLLVADACAVPPNPIDDRGRQSVVSRLGALHASPREAGEMAARAGVGRLVCTHLLAGAAAEAVATECAEAFSGPIEVGADLSTHQA